MLLGLVTDIHNHHTHLARALQLFHERRVDQVVTIGDTCDAFSKGGGATEVARLLNDCSAKGVWGNHDYSLSHKVPDSLRTRFSEIVLQVMARMQPRLIIDNCYFSHKESSVDPFDVVNYGTSATPPLTWQIEPGRRSMLLLNHGRLSATTTAGGQQLRLAHCLGMAVLH